MNKRPSLSSVLLFVSVFHLNSLVAPPPPIPTPIPQGWLLPFGIPPLVRVEIEEGAIYSSTSAEVWRAFLVPITIAIITSLPAILIAIYSCWKSKESERLINELQQAPNLLPPSAHSMVRLRMIERTSKGGPGIGIMIRNRLGGQANFCLRLQDCYTSCESDAPVPRIVPCMIRPGEDSGCFFKVQQPNRFRRVCARLSSCCAGKKHTIYLLYSLGSCGAEASTAAAGPASGSAAVHSVASSGAAVYQASAAEDARSGSGSSGRAGQGPEVDVAPGLGCFLLSVCYHPDHSITWRVVAYPAQDPTLVDEAMIEDCATHSSHVVKSGEQESPDAEYNAGAPCNLRYSACCFPAAEDVAAAAGALDNSRCRACTNFLRPVSRCVPIAHRSSHLGGTTEAVASSIPPSQHAEGTAFGIEGGIVPLPTGTSNLTLRSGASPAIRGGTTRAPSTGTPPPPADAPSPHNALGSNRPFTARLMQPPAVPLERLVQLQSPQESFGLASGRLPVSQQGSPEVADASGQLSPPVSRASSICALISQKDRLGEHETPSSREGSGRPSPSLLPRGEALAVNPFRPNQTSPSLAMIQSATPLGRSGHSRAASVAAALTYGSVASPRLDSMLSPGGLFSLSPASSSRDGENGSFKPQGSPAALVRSTSNPGAPSSTSYPIDSRPGTGLKRGSSGDSSHFRAAAGAADPLALPVLMPPPTPLAGADATFASPLTNAQCPAAVAVPGGANPTRATAAFPLPNPTLANQQAATEELPSASSTVVLGAVQDLRIESSFNSPPIYAAPDSHAGTVPSRSPGHLSNSSGGVGSAPGVFHPIGHPTPSAAATSMPPIRQVSSPVSIPPTPLPSASSAAAESEGEHRQVTMLPLDESLAELASGNAGTQ